LGASVGCKHLSRHAGAAGATLKRRGSIPRLGSGHTRRQSTCGEGIYPRWVAKPPPNLHPGASEPVAAGEACVRLRSSREIKHRGVSGKPHYPGLRLLCSRTQASPAATGIVARTRTQVKTGHAFDASFLPRKLNGHLSGTLLKWHSVCRVGHSNSLLSHGESTIDP
jgi:hypothetical protein